ncbi:MAG: wax ester/triacylglycerol synthase family O-acyltransferase [Candidatus Hydrogenedentes bacterium]|nr:wax ester/triacylglycerol synthase family O-acyltransferase [Candidatus Hydrogenedentota bacterium]
MSSVAESDRLSPMDAFFIYLENEQQPMHVGSVNTFEGKIPFKKFRRHIESRIGHFHRYYQKLLSSPLNLHHPVWEDDPDFRIENHVFLHTLPAPGALEDLHALAGKIFSGMLDRGKPLWEIHLVHGFNRRDSAMILKVHHAMIDGVAGVSMALVLFDLSADAPPAKAVPFVPAAPRTGPTRVTEEVWDSAIGAVRHWTHLQRNALSYFSSFKEGEWGNGVQHFLKTMTEFMLPIRHMPFNKTRSNERVIAWTEFSFAEFRAIRAVLGGTLNDIVLTIIAGAVRRYLEERAPAYLKKSKTFRILAPVNIRNEAERGAIGNHISFLPIDVNLDIADPVDRLHAIHLRTQEMKTANIAHAVNLLFEALQSNTAAVQSMALSTGGNAAVQRLLGAFSLIPLAHMICTNVPGPQFPLYCAGHRLTSINVMLPVCLDMGINCGILSYDQKISVSFIADKTVAPEAALLMQHMAAEAEALRNAAAVSTAKYIQITRSGRSATPPKEAPQEACVTQH